jgi:hypothetical protein
MPGKPERYHLLVMVDYAKAETGHSSHVLPTNHNLSHHFQISSPNTLDSFDRRTQTQNALADAGQKRHDC